jgi:hypothetical protein
MHFISFNLHSLPFPQIKSVKSDSKLAAEYIAKEDLEQIRRKVIVTGRTHCQKTLPLVTAYVALPHSAL